MHGSTEFPKTKAIKALSELFSGSHTKFVLLSVNCKTDQTKNICICIRQAMEKKLAISLEKYKSSTNPSKIQTQGWQRKFKVQKTLLTMFFKSSYALFLRNHNALVYRSAFFLFHFKSINSRTVTLAFFIHTLNIILI